MNEQNLKEKPKEYFHIEQLIVEGKHAEALQLINQFEEKEENTLHDIILYNLLKCDILYQQGLWNEQFKLAENTYQESLELGNDLLSIDALLEMTEALIWLIKPTKSEQIIKQGNDLLEIQTNKHSLEYKLREAKAFYSKGLFYAWIKSDADRAIENLGKSTKLFESLQNKVGRIKPLIQSAYVFGILIGQHDHAIKLVEQSLALSEEYNYQYSNAFGLLIMGVNHSFKGDLDLGIKLLEQSLIKFKELNNKYFIGSALSYIATIYLDKGDLDKALEYAEQGLALAKEINNKLRIAESIVAVAFIYSSKGEVDHSICLYEQALKIFMEIDNKFGIGTILNNLANAYRIIGNEERAFECAKSSIAIYEELGNLWAVATAYDYLIQILIDKGDLGQAQEVIERFEQLNNQLNDKFINLVYLFDKALILKTSSKSRNRIEAEDILKQILADESVDYQFTIYILLNLCELLLTELRISNDLSVLDEINSFIAQLLDMAEKSHSFMVFAEVYFLKAKLSLLTLDVKSARRFLTQAQKVAERIGLNQLAVNVSAEHNNLLEQLSMWKNLEKSDISLKERIELAGLDKHMKEILKKSTIITTQISEQKVTIHKERKICLVCKGEIKGYIYVCDCDAIYCENCARALTDLENVCWVCNAPIDASKPIKPFKKEEDIESKIFEKTQK